MSIYLLSEETINKIAAGEIVENPASVVKELVENAIDAEAASVTVEIKAGGFSLIRVSDDGAGIGREDLPLSLARHATSKIQSSKDLHKVLSMGFRGEALASIAAISRICVTSRPQGAMVGACICCDGGKLGQTEERAHNVGTTIEVRSLFYNVPARKKFQKSWIASKTEIFKILTKLALAAPKCAFKYLSDEKEVFSSRAGTLKTTCREVLDEQLLKGHLYVDYSHSCCHLHGFLGSLSRLRKNRSGQYLFINGRGVLCFEIIRSIYDAYGPILDSKEHPTFVLHLTLPPEWVDVNVHPQKREVRLRERCVIQEAVIEGISLALQGGVGMVKSKAPLPSKLQSFNWSPQPPLRCQEKREASPMIFSFENAIEELPVVGQFSHFLILDGRMSTVHLPHAPPPYDGLILVNLQAAHARLLFERFSMSDVKSLQSLVNPHILEFAPHECEKLKMHLKEIAHMGIEVRPFGNSCLIVEALSPEIREDGLLSLFHALLEIFDEKISEKEQQKNLAIAVARYAKSRKKGWTMLEAKLLVKHLLKSSSPYFCPNGKCTMVYLSYESITQLFQKAP